MSEIFYKKIRRTEGERLGFALPPARPISRLRAAGAANHQGF